jgi:hypothetical protein
MASNSPFLSFGKSSRWLALVFFVFNYILALFKHPGMNPLKILQQDSLGYYQFLPAVFIDGNIRHLPWATVLENGNHLSLFHIGVAILQAPFFLLAHLSSVVFGFEADGYSVLYLHALFLAASFYLAIGLYFSFKHLKAYFNARTALMAVILIYLGSNLMFYSAKEVGMSHIYSFFLFASFIYCTPGFLAKPSWKNSSIISLLSALIVLIKPNNGILLLYLLFYDVKSLEDLRIRFRLFQLNFSKIIWMIVLAGMAVFPQLLYWKTVTGDWIVYSYGFKNEGFNWLAPELWNVLFSHQNGWLLYSPLPVFALIGLFWGAVKRVSNFALTGLILLLAWYIFASWWNWWFGAAFGHRAFVEYLALLMVPLAFFLERIQEKHLSKWFYFISSILVFVNIRMMSVYHPPWDGPDWTWSSFLEVLQKVVYIGTPL